MSYRLVIALLAVLVAAPLEAQRAPRRPRLANNADTNDARAYFDLGLTTAERDPAKAEAAFYWTTRLDPLSPQALYAEGVAALLRNRNGLVAYLTRDQRSLSSPQVLAIDSLRFRAEMQDPFFHRGLEELVLNLYVATAARGNEWHGTSSSGRASDVLGAGAAENGRSQGASGADAGIATATERYLETANPHARGVLFYSQNRLREALQAWAMVMQNQAATLVRANNDWVLADRARAFAELRQVDSAQAALRAAVRVSRADDAGYHVYESRAAWTFALGRLLEDRRDTTAAREAYERALGYDGNYYPAAIRLGVMALQQGDTAGAVGALRRAVDRPDVQFFACAAVATVLSSLGRHEAAAAILRRATEIEPFASAGWLALARSLQAQRDNPGAIAAYEKFLALAARDDGMRPASERTLTALRGN